MESSSAVPAAERAPAAGPGVAGAGIGANLTLYTLVEMDAAELLNLRDFYAERLQAELLASRPLSNTIELINRAIAEKYDATAKLAFEKAAKTDGKVSVDLPGGLKLSASISKRVDWDQDKLMAAAKNLPWADVQHYFTIKFGVPEKIYKALPPSSELKAKLDEARTEKRGEMTITLERKDAAPAGG